VFVRLTTLCYVNMEFDTLRISVLEDCTKHYCFRQACDEFMNISLQACGNRSVMNNRLHVIEGYFLLGDLSKQLGIDAK